MKTLFRFLAVIALAGQLRAADLTLSANADTLLQAADFAAMRTSLGLVIGTNVQAFDADLTTWAGVTPGTGVATALALNVGSAGAPVLFNGAGGTPTSIALTNATGTAASLTAGTVTTNANLTGHVTSAGNAAVLGTFTLAQLSTAVSDANIARTDAGQTLTGVQAMTSPALTTSVTTPSTTFELFNTTATTINFAGSATTLNFGASATQILNFGGSTTASEFRFLEPSGSGTNYTALKAGAQAANITYTWPATVGGAGTYLRDAAGNGVLDWAAVAGSGDVTAAAAFATDNVLIKSDGTGKGVQFTGISVDDSNNITGVAAITATTGSITTFKILDSVNQSHGLSLVAGSDLTADRNLTFTTGDAARTLTIFGSTTIPVFGQQITFAGPTAARTITLPDAAFTVARTDAANTFTGTQTIGALVATTVNGNTVTTGTGTLTLGASKTLTVTESATLNRQASTGLPVEIGVAMSDETTAITTGTAKVTMRAPYAFTVTGVRASVNTVSSSGIPTVDINEAGTTIISTKLTIDASELTSQTAAAAAVISDTAIADDAELTFDVDVAGTGAKGLKVWILGYR